MQVVLKQNVPGLGQKGKIVNVSDGYFQNYLFPKKLAEKATEAKIREAQFLQQKQVAQKEELAGKAQEIQQKLKGLKLTFKEKAKGDKLYGSITQKDICAQIEQKTGVSLEEKQIVLSEHIKVLGSYEIPVRLTESIEVVVKLEVKLEK